MATRVLPAILAAIVLLISAASTLIARPAEEPARGPSISWNPSKVVAEVRAGSITKTDVQLITDTRIDAAALRIVPELETFVTAEPAEFAVLLPGAPQTIRLRIAIPPNTPLGTLDGTFQVRTTQVPLQVVAKPLPITLSILPLDVPPDPGEDGERTLQGIDSDGDGVRDDVQRFIAIEYWEQPLVQQGLRQYAHALQVTLTNTDTLVAEEAVDRAARCLRHLYGGRVLEAANERDRVSAEVLNTRERSLVYLSYNARLSGRAYPIVGSKPEDCTFAIEVTP